jgi:hypothetical protein
MRVSAMIVYATLACGGRPVGDGPSGSGTASEGEPDSSATSSSTTEDGDGSSTDGSSTDGTTDGSSTGGSCVGTPDNCVEGSPQEDAYACGHLAVPAECIDGAWTCGLGFVRPDQCACYYRSPQPVCLQTDGRTCTHIIESAVCEGVPKAGAWTCPPGSIPEEECGFEASSSTTG